MSDLTRRDLMRAAVAAGVAGVLAGSLPSFAENVLASGAEKIASTTPPDSVLRFAHLTDMHVTDKELGDRGYAAALRSVDQYHPAFIITGGDHVMDASGQTRRQAVAWYDIYERVLAQNTKLAVYPCIGNHDVYGW